MFQFHKVQASLDGFGLFASNEPLPWFQSVANLCRQKSWYVLKKTKTWLSLGTLPSGLLNNSLTFPPNLTNLQWSNLSPWINENVTLIFAYWRKLALEQFEEVTYIGIVWILKGLKQVHNILNYMFLNVVE